MISCLGPRSSKKRLSAPRRKCPIITAGFLLLIASADAQEPDQPPAPPVVHEHVAVTATALTPTREATGTGWLPTVTPMYGLHRPWRGWDVRLDGAAFVQYLYEPGDRHRTGGAARHQVGSVNWIMVMGRRPAGSGRFGVRTMFSAEPWTVTDCGSLNLLATDEVCDGDTIHDRRQPHDLMMELAVDYEQPLRQAWRWQVYAALAGEPALGPPGYPHRASAMSNPVAPVTHHWLDGTHVSFGVITVGVHDQRWKAEASIFNGREPDEERYDLDLGAFDSFSGRLSYLPTERLALQISAGRVHEARTEFLNPSPEPATKGTASLIYHRPLGERGIWATTVAGGLDFSAERISGVRVDMTTSALLAESSVTIGGRQTIFGRAEVFGMPAHLLHANEFGTSVFTMGKVQLGYLWHFPTVIGLVPGIGATASVSFVPTELAPRYGGHAAPGYGVFFNLKPARHAM